MEEGFAGRRVTIMGLGTFGAGLAATRFFAEAGAAVTVTDLRTEQQLADSIAMLGSYPSICWHLNGHSEEDFTNSDLIVVSPSVRPTHPLLELARSQGIPLTSEIRLFWERCPAPIIGVTGSNGKSTTCQLIHDILQADGRRVWLGGNIGRSLLNNVAAIQPHDWVVLELSSFQLTDLDAGRMSPHVAVITSFTPNHLDWHGSLSGYESAKRAILRWQRNDDIAIRRAGTTESGWPVFGQHLLCGREPDDNAAVTIDESRQTLHLSGRDQSIDLSTCPALRGRHLGSAALLATATASALGVDIESITEGLRAFEGLPHRLQIVSRRSGRIWVNDSAATTPESTLAALEAQERPPVLIAGGTEKGCSLNQLAEAMLTQARIVVLFGEVSRPLERLVEQARDRVMPSQHRLENLLSVSSLEEAVSQAASHSREGEVVLFSPGFASGSMFRDYAARGDAFASLARNPPAST